MGFFGRLSSKKKENAVDAELKEGESEYLMGIGYYEQQSYEESLKCFRSAAEKGHVGAQYRLGRMYYDGVCVELSEEEAYKWFKLAADKGEKESQFVLASMYIRGNGVEKISYYEAFKWFKAASENGHPGATMNLGYLYASGSGTAQSDSDAFKCYMSVAEKDNPYAQYSVGNLYNNYIRVHSEYYKEFLQACKEVNNIYGIFPENYEKQQLFFCDT